MLGIYSINLSANLCFFTLITFHFFLFPVFAWSETTQFSIPENFKSGDLIWTPQQQKEYGDFIYALGKEVESRRCGHVDQCLLQSKNTKVKAVIDRLRSNVPDFGKKYHLYADCADLGKFTETLYLMSKGLPVVYRRYIRTKPKKKGDEEKSKGVQASNEVGSMAVILPRDASKLVGPEYRFLAEDAAETENTGGQLSKMQREATGRQLFAGTITNTVYTLSMSDDPTSKKSEQTDYYSPAFKALKRGSNFYNGKSHFMMVYDIAKDGALKILDAHPDGSLTIKNHSPSLGLPIVNIGAAFRNIRPFRIYFDSNNQDKPKIEFLNNKEVPYSDEQFRRRGLYYRYQDPKSGKSYLLTYVDKIRMELAKGKIKLDPIAEMRKRVRSFCHAIRTRIRNVQDAIKAGIDKMPHPGVLPGDLSLGGGSVWVKHSTTSRDSVLKQMVRSMFYLTKKYDFYAQQGIPQFSYKPGSRKLPADLYKVLQEEDKRCTAGQDYDGKPLGYIKSNGKFQKLTLKQVLKRMHSMSFDPFHCIEMRMGANAGSKEFQSCDSSQAKRVWYHAQSGIRCGTKKPRVLPQATDLRTLYEYLVEKNTKGKPSGYANWDVDDLDFYRYMESQVEP